MIVVCAEDVKYGIENRLDAVMKSDALRQETTPKRSFYRVSLLRIEMTWGETAATQLQVKEKPLKQSSCFALTSIGLLDTAYFTASV